MGCGTSKSLPRGTDASSDNLRKVKSTSADRGNNRPSIGVGQPLGGVSGDPNKRQAQLEAAEKRAVAYANRGLGGNQKSGELSEVSQKQELIGRINEMYYRIKKDPPIGLNLASLDQLRKHYDQVKKAGGGVSVNID